MAILNKVWAYRDAADAAVDIATINAASEFTTMTNARAIDIGGLKQLNLQAKMTGGNAGSVGPVDFYVQLYDDDTQIPTSESFIMRVVVTGNTAQRTPQSFRVNHRWMRILKVSNLDAAQTVTAVNLMVSSGG